jgi:tetratricopeptide (TPR) repeat protein
MLRDQHGLALSTSSAQASAAFDRTLLAYLGYRADAAQQLGRTLAADEEFGLAHCLAGYFALLSYKQATLPMAAAAARSARAAMMAATAREKAHLAALEAWIAGDLEQSLALWDGICAEHPTDVLAFRLAHFNNFWLGRPAAMRAAAERALPGWDRALPGYSTILSCLSFACEECGDHDAAEAAGRAALASDPGDLWGLHALAHVMEMQGRRRDGIDLLRSHEPHFAGGNNFVHHLWWHRALFHLEQRDVDAVLELYDRRFRNLAAPLTEAQPDLYIDVQNAASMLFRLERLGVDVGDRWIELADKAEPRIGDCLSAFTQPHWMMALAATGREAAAQRLLAGMREFARGPGRVAAIVGAVALPVSAAVLAHRQGRHAQAVELMRPVLDRMSELGGSHAQQDVLEQLFLDAAMKAERGADVRLALARAAARYPGPLQNRAGYAAAARRFGR